MMINNNTRSAMVISFSTFGSGVLWISGKSSRTKAFVWFAMALGGAKLDAVVHKVETLESQETHAVPFPLLHAPNEFTERKKKKEKIGTQVNTCKFQEDMHSKEGRMSSC